MDKTHLTAVRSINSIEGTTKFASKDESGATCIWEDNGST